MEMPGVGPKTADVVLLFSANKPTIPVDTHVNRVSKRLGLAPPKGDYEAVRLSLQSLLSAPRLRLSASATDCAWQKNLQSPKTPMPNLPPKQQLPIQRRHTMSKPVVKLPPEVMEYFPYSAARPHQDEFITTVYKPSTTANVVLIEGSNGLGKTISALSAVLPVAMKKNLKVLYVARTHRQHDRVIDELRMIYKNAPNHRRLHSWTQRNVPKRLRRKRCFRLQITYGSLRTPEIKRQMPILQKRRKPHLRVHFTSAASSQPTLHGLRNPAGMQEKRNLPL